MPHPPPDLYLYADAIQSRSYLNITWVTLLIQDTVDRKKTLTLLLPTASVHGQLMPGHFDRLITFIEGPVLDEFGIWDDQREYLLTIALGYRAFTEGASGVDLNDFRELARLLIEGALGTEPDERVDDELRTIADWLHEALPEHVFDTVPSPPRARYSVPPVTVAGSDAFDIDSNGDPIPDLESVDSSSAGGESPGAFLRYFE
ncbi:hypothetical protein TRAPUB_2359 [Trametes pubescens]|uniref:Uncharacterized protein n=1 Tax=Trametes pubescens TaxID=154538 RepID=A0A1M2VGQ7_TRAPU|nr:hypothetical protein TRAPUB_2359 [Trametes pubescens]